MAGKVARSGARSARGRARSGSRVGLLFSGTDWIDYAVAYLGVLRAGTAGVHVNDKLSGAEIDRRLTGASASYLIHGSGGPPATLTRFTGPAVPLTALTGGGTGPLPVTVAPEDIADVHYTSGTTSAAKAYLVPHGNVTFGRDPATLRNFTAGGSMLVPMEPGSSSAASCVLAAIISPMTSVLCSPDDVEHAAKLIADLGVSAVAITPWIASQLVAAKVNERYDLSTVTMIACASAPLPGAIARGLLAMMPGARLTGAFSQSEASPALLVSVFDLDKPLAVGRPNATTELLLVDDAGQPVPPGELGQIWLRHPAPRRLYLDPARNETLLADGWYRTGDYGWLSKDGDLFLFDRGADLIRTVDGPVSSLAVEAELYEHPAVREVAVVSAAAAARADRGVCRPDRPGRPRRPACHGRRTPRAAPAAPGTCCWMPSRVTTRARSSSASSAAAWPDRAAVREKRHYLIAVVRRFARCFMNMSETEGSGCPWAASRPGPGTGPGGSS